MTKLINPYRGAACPITGKTIVTDSQWDITTPTYTVFFGVIEKRIVLLKAIGRATEQTSILYEEHFSQVVRDAIIPALPYATCDDYSDFEHSTNKARTVFLSNIGQYHKLLKYICFYNVKPFFRFVIKLSRKLLPHHFKIDIANDYVEALQKAFLALGLDIPLEPKQPMKIDDYITDPAWKYKCGNVEHEFRIYRSNIIYNRLSEGMTAEQVDVIAKIDLLVNKFLRELNGDGEFFSIVDLSSIYNIPYRVRKLYADKMGENDKSFRCSYSVMVGTNFFTRVGVYLGRFVMAYPIDFAESVDRAFEMIEQFRGGRNQIQFEFKNERDEVDQFIEYLSSVQWKKDELHFEGSIPSEGRMIPAYEAIEMIRNDLNLLLEKQKEKERELNSLGEQLKEANDLLEKRVTQRTMELAEKNRLMGLFFAKISHDLRTPLQGIISFSKFGISKMGQVSSETLQKYFSNILHSSDNLLQLINQLLDFNQLTSGKMNFSMNLNTLNVAVDNVILHLAALLDEKKIALECSMSQMIYLSFDQLRIEQLITNLLGNAIKFSSPGGVVYLRLLLDKKEDREIAIIEIEDRGIGIPHNDLSDLFEHFHQCSNNTSASSGSGLGLTICKEIVHAHGGNITARNASPTGAIFRVELPILSSFSI